MSLRQNILRGPRTKQDIIAFLLGGISFYSADEHFAILIRSRQCRNEVCRSFLLLVLPTRACQRKGAKHEDTMCLKHVHFGSSLSGALIINLWLPFDYRFDYLFFCVGKPRGFLDHLSRITAFGGAISFSMLSYDVAMS